MTTNIDLSRLPAPEALAKLDFEDILQAGIREYKQQNPDFSLTLESDPTMKVMRFVAAKVLHLRQAINDQCKSILLAYAQGSDLDHLGSLFDEKRPENDSDDNYRKRIQQSLGKTSTAGSEQSYIYHAFKASPKVKDVHVTQASPGCVDVFILNHENQGTADETLISTVSQSLNSKTVRPLTDKVIVKTAEIISFSVKAKLELGAGPDAEVVQKYAREALEKYLNSRCRLGATLARAGITAALFQAGVTNVHLEEPKQDLVLQSHQVANCQNVLIT